MLFEGYKPVHEFSYFSMECFSIIEVVTKSRDSLLITAPVLVPGEEDCEFVYGEEPLTEGQVRQIAHDYLASYGLVDKNHEFFKTREVIGVPVESYITDEPISLKGLDGIVREYPKGTWIATTRITDEEEMEKALNGEYTGYSITTVSRKFADKQMSIPRRVLMKDVKDPVGFTISLVKKPCVKGAKFCSMKEDLEKDGDVVSENIDEKLEEETKGFVQSIKGIFNKEDKQDERKPEDEEIEIDFKAIVEEATKDFVNADDFETFKKELEKELSEKFETLGTELFKAIKKSLDKEEDDETKKKEEEKDDEQDDEEDIGEADDTQNVQSSKSIPNHDTKDKQKAVKTGTARVYEIMGRDNTGSAIRKL